MLKSSRIVIVEFLSAISFLMMATGLAIQTFISPDMRSEIFWAVIFSIIGSMQILSLLYKEDLPFVRICSAWISGTIWVILAYASINSIMAVTVFFIGLFNIYAFVHLVNRANYDWTAFTHRIENGDSHT